MVPAKRGGLCVEAPTRHLIEALLRISHVTELVNALFWSTQWSTQTESPYSLHRTILNRSTLTQDRLKLCSICGCMFDESMCLHKACERLIC